MEEASGGEGDDPETDDERADSEDHVADAAVAGGEGRRFANADLAADADEHQKSADDEGSPGHGLTFLP
jgi:hypothetical protein